MLHLPSMLLHVNHDSSQRDTCSFFSARHMHAQTMHPDGFITTNQTNPCALTSASTSRLYTRFPTCFH